MADRAVDGGVAGEDLPGSVESLGAFGALAAEGVFGGKSFLPDVERLRRVDVADVDLGVWGNGAGGFEDEGGSLGMVVGVGVAGMVDQGCAGNEAASTLRLPGRIDAMLVEIDLSEGFLLGLISSFCCHPCFDDIS